MNNGPVYLCVLLLMARGAVAQKAGTKEDAASVFANSPAFNKSVKVTCPGLAVGELLSQLSAKTGIKLLANKAIEDEKVVIFSQARPLKDTLNDLATLFHDEWRHSLDKDSGDQYTLIRTRASTDYEQKLSKATHDRVIARLDEQVKALGESPEELAKRDQNDPIGKALKDPGNRVATTVFAALSPEQRTALFDTRVRNYPATEIGPQLTEPIRELYKMCVVRAARFNGGVTAEHGDTVQDYASRGIQFALHNCGGNVTASIYAYGKTSMMGFLFADVPNIDLWAVRPHGNPYSSKPTLDTDRLPTADQTQKAENESTWIDRLQKLSEVTGAPVVADYYRCGDVNLVPATATPFLRNTSIPPAIAALDNLCWKKGYAWWNGLSGTLFFRKRDWFEQQKYEVPDRWLTTTVNRMKEQKHIPKVADLLRARELTAQQILGLNGMQAGDGFSYSEFETVGTPEMAEFLSHEFSGHLLPGSQQPIIERPLDAGRMFEKAYDNKDLPALAMDMRFTTFLNAQAAPIPVSDIQYFQADIYSEDRGGGPEGGWKNASVVVNWRVGPLLDKRMSVCMPFEIPDDRRAQVKIEVQ